MRENGTGIIKKRKTTQDHSKEKRVPHGSQYGITQRLATFPVKTDSHEYFRPCGPRGKINIIRYFYQKRESRF